MTLGNTEQYTKICTIRDKRAYISVGRFEPRAATLENGKVKLTWFPIGSENDGIKSFLPEGWSLTLLRTAHYYKNGIEINDATELNITDKFTYQNAEGLSEYIEYYEGWEDNTWLMTLYNMSESNEKVYIRYYNAEQDVVYTTKPFFTIKNGDFLDVRTLMFN